MATQESFSKAELEVMKVFWRRGRTAAKDVQQELTKKRGWRTTTVLTFIARLHEKGHLKREKIGGVYLYTPALTEKKTVGKIVQDFVNRLFDGDIMPLMNYLSEGKTLNKEEIAALKKLATKAKEERDD